MKLHDNRYSVEECSPMLPDGSSVSALTHKDLAIKAKQATKEFTEPGLVFKRIGAAEYYAQLSFYKLMASRLGCVLSRNGDLPCQLSYAEYVRKILDDKVKGMNDDECADICRKAFRMMHYEGDWCCGYLDEYIRDTAKEMGLK